MVTVGWPLSSIEKLDHVLVWDSVNTDDVVEYVEQQQKKRPKADSLTTEPVLVNMT